MPFALALAALLAAAMPPADSTPEPSAPVSVPAEGAPAAQPKPAPHGTSWFALPVVFYLPETRLGFGATGGLHHRMPGAPRTSSAFLTAVYTLEKQGSLDLAGDLYLPDGMLFTGRARLVDFPDLYYGIGPSTSDANRERYTRRFAEAQAALELPVVRGLRIGPRLDLRSERIVDVQAGGELEAGAVPGADGFSATGLGANVTWDTRDGAFWPSRGTFAQGWALLYPGLGSQPEFARGGVEVRQFVPLGAGRVLGFAGAVEAASDGTPFTLLPRLGSTRYLRGYREGRYRDRRSWWAQSELRVPVVGRLSATAFGALGDVAPRLDAFRLETVKAAGGLGLRWRLSDEGANIRVDVAGSGNGIELYVLVLEAF
jgi:hypothetical protein